MESIDSWPLFLDTYLAISRHYVPVMDQKAAEYNLYTVEGWLLLAALSFEPEVVSPEKLRIRSPYVSAQRYAGNLEKLAEGGFIEADPDFSRAYRLTTRGGQAMTAILNAGYSIIKTLQPLDQADLDALADRLYQLVTACLEAPEPPGKWSITHSRNLDPGDEAAVMVRIDQYLSDLAAYRDDSHLAAWQVHNIEGHAWEILTLIWREGLFSLDDLAERIARRGFTSSEHDQALSDLVERGWVVLENNTYSLSQSGKAIRETVEVETDRYFYRPWSHLSGQELDTLTKQLMRLMDALQADN